MPTKKKGKPAMDAATDRLYKAVQNYVEKKGGKLMVIGGIQIQEWPNDPAFVFRVAVKCLGRKPDFVPAQNSNVEKP